MSKHDHRYTVDGKRALTIRAKVVRKRVRSKANAARARRIAYLLDAQDGLDAVERATRKVKSANPNEYRAMQIDVGDYCEAGGSPDAGIEIDPPLARKLIPLLRDLIGDELAALGYGD